MPKDFSHIDKLIKQKKIDLSLVQARLETERVTEELIRETIHESKKANQIQIYKFLSKLKECLSKKELINIGIRPSDDFVKSQLVLAMAHGVTLTLCKGDFIALMDKCLNELFNTQLLL